MKEKIIIVLILNVIMLMLSVFVFITKGLPPNFILWKFITSLTSVIIFGIFILLLIKQLNKI